MKHPLYTAVALLVIPWIGFLLNTWLGVVIGLVLYVAARLFAPQEEAELARRSGPGGTRTRPGCMLPWL